MHCGCFWYWIAILYEKIGCRACWSMQPSIRHADCNVSGPGANVPVWHVSISISKAFARHTCQLNAPLCYGALFHRYIGFSGRGSLHRCVSNELGKDLGPVIIIHKRAIYRPHQTSFFQCCLMTKTRFIYYSIHKNEIRGHNMSIINAKHKQQHLQSMQWSSRCKDNSLYSLLLVEPTARLMYVLMYWMLFFCMLSASHEY